MRGYQQFMKLKLSVGDWDGTQLSPSIVVDLVWHQHLLAVGHYFQACQSFAGRLIDHNPNGGLDHVAREERIRSFKVAIKALFGRDVDMEVWKFPGDSQPVHPNSETLRGGSQPRPSKRSRPNQNERDNPQDGAKIPITLRVRYQAGDYIFFKVKRSTRFRVLFQTYAERRGVDVKGLRFMLGRFNRINPWQTPELLDLEDQDQIYVMLEQVGC